MRNQVDPTQLPNICCIYLYLRSLVAFIVRGYRELFVHIHLCSTYSFMSLQGATLPDFRDRGSADLNLDAVLACPSELL